MQFFKMSGRKSNDHEVFPMNQSSDIKVAACLTVSTFGRTGILKIAALTGCLVSPYRQHSLVQLL